MKIAIESMQDEMRQAAKGSAVYKYSLPMVILSVSDHGVGVTVCIGDLERKADSLQSFDAAMIKARLLTKWICAQLDGNALARTLGIAS